MVWQQWFYLTWSVLGFALIISQIGKTRKPLSPGAAATAFALQAALVTIVLSI